MIGSLCGNWDNAPNWSGTIKARELQGDEVRQIAKDATGADPNYPGKDPGSGA